MPATIPSTPTAACQPDAAGTIEISPFEPRRARAVLDLVLSIQQREFGLPVSADSQPDLVDIARSYQSGNGNFWIALNASQVVGSIGLLDIGQRQGVLRKMFVAAPMRGSRYGVGQKLLETLLQWCRERGMTEVWLGTTEKVQAAHRFYEKNGFDRIEPQWLPRRFPVMEVDTRFYRCSLPAAPLLDPAAGRCATA